MVRVETSLSDRVFIAEHSQPVQSFSWRDTRNCGAVDVEVMAEFFDIDLQVLDADNKLFLELGLATHQLISDFSGLLDEFSPFLIKDVLRIDVLAHHFLDLIGLEKAVHVDDWAEVDLDLRLLLTDIFKCMHHMAERVDVLRWLGNLETDMCHVIFEFINHAVSLLVQILCVGHLPQIDSLLKGIFDVRRLQVERTDLFVVFNCLDFNLVGTEASKLMFKLIKARVGLIELS